MEVATRLPLTRPRIPRVRLAAEEIRLLARHHLPLRSRSRRPEVLQRIRRRERTVPAPLLQVLLNLQTDLARPQVRRPELPMQKVQTLPPSPSACKPLA